MCIYIIYRFPKPRGYPQIIQVMDDQTIVLKPMMTWGSSYDLRNPVFIYIYLFIICIYIHIYIHIHIYIYVIHICIYTYMYTYIHIGYPIM